MIRASISASGTLTLRADNELESFALGEWERRRKAGKATLVLDLTVVEANVQQPGNNTKYSASIDERVQSVIALMEGTGPTRAGHLAELMGISVPSVYGYLSRARQLGKATNKNGLWSAA